MLHSIVNRVGRGIVGSQEIRSGACRYLLAPYKVSLSSPEPPDRSGHYFEQKRFAAYLSLILDRGATDHLH